MNDEVALLKRKLERERKARKAAEKILEEKSLELYQSNEALKVINSNLELLVDERTRDLKRSESRFRLIVETAMDIIYRIDENGLFTYANPVAIEKMGYSMAELRKMHFTELVAPHAREKVEALYAEQFENKVEKTYYEFPVVTRSGRVFMIGQNVIFLFHRDGSVDRVNAVARDITENKVSETRLRNLISTLQSGVLLEDENRKIALANETFCELFGIPVSAEELEGEDCTDSAEQNKILFKHESGFVDRINEILEAREQVFNDELELKDGRIFERDYIPIFIDNHYSGHLWNYRDVTSQRNQLLAIQRSEEKYRGIIENMNLGMLEVDMDETIRYANQSFCEMSGWDLEEIIGKDANRLFVQGDYTNLMDNKKELRGKGVSDAYEMATRNKRGEPKWWLISGAPLRNEKNQYTGSIGIHLDITQQKELEKDLVEAREAAEESSRAKEAFLANMSHEIRTPMNGIVGMTRELFRTELDEPQRFYLDTIRSAADHLLVVINDILDLSKIEAGKLSIENVPFQLSETVHQACQVMQPRAEEKGLQLSIHIDDQLASHHRGDPHRLNQLLLNLLGNAIKFTEKGCIEVGAHMESSKHGWQEVILRVKDPGIGMDADYLDKIFDPFSQQDRSTAREFGGTGLGMSITKQLVELMNGSIAINSQKGVGTEVLLRIPLAESRGQESDQHLEESDYALLSGKRILVAEDNELNRLVIETTLRHYHVQLDFATNGQEAIDLLKEAETDIVLMDVQMPVMDGIEATKVLREEMKLTLPIIALTANVLQGDREHYLASGMNDAIPKPFEEADLLEVLMRWLGKPRAQMLMETEMKVAPKKAGFSLEKLESIGRGNPEFVQRMITVFCEQVDASIERMTKARQEEDYDAVRKIAHRMKPSIDNLAIGALLKEVRELEKIAGEGQDIDRINELVDLFVKELTDVKNELLANQV